MRTVSIFLNGKNHAIRLPKDMQYDETITELVITKDGDTITLKPARPTWTSLANVDLDGTDRGSINEE